MAGLKEIVLLHEHRLALGAAVSLAGPIKYIACMYIFAQCIFSHLTTSAAIVSSSRLLPSVPARPISEGAAPCPIYTRPARIKKKMKKCRCKNACKMLADLCPCFHQSPTRPNFGRSRVKDFVSFAH